ncbi:MAG TPA: metal-sensitive transcriptional regulator, partial [Chloroflexota bacterium]|nr:metal-sensitive transcriptional regulator [Chloroflexota bacterium]
MSDSIQQRLRKIEGQVRGLERMLDAGRGCDDILT